MVAGVVGWFEDPRLGVSVTPLPDGRMAITKVLPGGPVYRLSPAEVGDILIEIDGLAVTEDLINRRGTTGTSFVIAKLDTNGVRTGVFRGQQTPPISSTAVAVSLLIIGSVFALTSFFVFFRSARSPEILVLSLLLMTMASALVISPASARWFYWPSLVGPLIVVWAAALFVVFFFWFPLKRKSNRLMSAAVLYGMPIGALAISILFLLTFETDVDIYESVRRLAFFHLALGFLGGIAFLIAALVSASSAVNREQLRIMAVGISAGILPFILLTIVPQSLGLSTYVRPEISVLGIAIVPLSLAFAIHRYQFMEIRRLVHRGAAYMLISFSVLIIYGLLIALIGVLAGGEVSESLGLQVTLMVLLFAVLPFVFGTRRFAFATVDRLLYREYLDHPDLTRRLSVDASIAQNADDLSNNVLGTLLTELRLSFASFGRVRNDTTMLIGSVGAVPSGIREQVAALAGKQSNLPVYYSENLVDDNRGDAMMVEVRRSPTLAWVLCLGPKVTEEPFSKDDADLAQSVAGHLTTVSEKLDLMDELQTKNSELTAFTHRLVETEEAERSRIASYLHDEPLQQISNLIWRHSESGMPEDLGSELQGIAENLRNFTARLQPAQLRDLGLVRSLEWLVEEAGAAGDFQSMIDARSVCRDTRFSDSLELAIYRIAQEALANYQHHSKAANVWVQLTNREDKLVLVIEDDGVGFVPSKRTDANKQLGLIGMRERANQLGGQVEITKRQPRGTKIVVSLPCGNIDRLETSDKAGL
jgi:signal transduction histidine kinase